MSDQLDVLLHDRLVATITNVPGDLNIVAIDPDYRDDVAAPTLSLNAFRDPVTRRYRETIRPTRGRVHPYFSNLLPEGPLRTYLARHAHVKPVREFPLLWVLGVDLPGALVMRHHDGGPAPPPDDHEQNDRGDRDEELLRFSLAGVQLKFSATGSPQRGLTFPAEGRGGSWIVKLPDQRFANVPENEYSMMTFARAVGIDVPEIALVDPAEVGGLPGDVRNLTGRAYAIRRFDRGNAGARIHTEDFAQANVLYPEQKYRAFNFDRLAREVADWIGSDAALEIVRRIVFGVGIGNGDMHAKNWSMIYPDQHTPAVAPAYDYLSTVIYMPDDDLGLNFAGTKAFTDVSAELVSAFADRASLPRRPVLRAAAEMVDRMRDIWPGLRGELPMEERQLAAIEAHMERVPLFVGRGVLTG
ncbi:MAG: type II toxin-antitoxin system HipA family toxin [Vulcanimicrobiaceae bacterium]